jgi:hypothetical protein
MSRRRRERFLNWWLRRGGPKLKAAVPGSPVPSGIAKLPSGNWMQHKIQPDGKQVLICYGNSMQDLAWFLTIISGRVPVRDKTGLTVSRDGRV